MDGSNVKNKGTREMNLYQRWKYRNKTLVIERILNDRVILKLS